MNSSAFSLVLLFLVLGCQPAQPPRFVKLEAARTGIDFENKITTSPDFNSLEYEYIYNGAGVGIGDLNGDDLPDLFFAGNQVSSRLYLNGNNLNFQDVTEESGVATERWCSGVSLIDINDDGRLDIYLSVAGFGVSSAQMANLLFLNEGNNAAGVPHFRECAAAFGLADTAYTTQTAFLDYDLDGYVDAYVLNNSLEKFDRNRLRPIRTDGSARSNDHLYHNNGDGTFSDVSHVAGILKEGYGLGVNASDLNQDGLPDIYAANDFLSNDLIWINNGDGTFTDRAAEYLRHTSHNGMGVDIADMNNDLLPDIAEMDMLPENNYRQKMMIPYVNRDRFMLKKQYGYQDQYMRNTLQLNRGRGADGHPRFSEIGNLAGVAATDWSWAVLFADYDLDGLKDIFVTNGYRKDVTNLDFASYSSYSTMFGTKEARRERTVADLNAIAEVPLPNHLFHNEKGVDFRNVAAAWGLDIPSFSTGAAYGDLDGDGDLELVVNNIDQPAAVYENRSRTGRDDDPAYLRVKLVEKAENLTPLNAKLYLYAGATAQYQELSPFRGYVSSVDPVLTFGLEDGVKEVDSLVIVWANGHRQSLLNPAINKLHQGAYAGKESTPRLPAVFKEVTWITPRSLENPFVHGQHGHDDFRQSFTLSHGFSHQGPALAVGDIDGDGDEDFIIGGNTGQPARCYFQESGGGFTDKDFTTDEHYLDTDMALFDADNDGDLDLYVVSGGTHLPVGDEGYRDRLYLNDGNGNFICDAGASPAVAYSGSCVRPGDYDNDGDLDLFIGSRILPGNYPLFSPSQLLRNDDGRFTDVTPQSLKDAGLVTDACWLKSVDDHTSTLVVAAEWAPIKQWTFSGGQWQVGNITIVDGQGHTITPPQGWWFHLNVADIDGDGDQDILAGNLGTNGPFRAAPDTPVSLYAKDFDGNGAIDPLLFTYVTDRQAAFHERDLLIKQIPSMKRRFTNYESYANAVFDQVLTPEDVAGSTQLDATEFRSILLENRGDGTYHFRALPLLAQVSPVRSSLIEDLNGDGRKDLILAGNLHETEVTQIGNYDGNYGTILLNRGNWEWELLPSISEGLELSGDVSQLRLLQTRAGKLLLAATYGDTLRTMNLITSPKTLSQ